MIKIRHTHIRHGIVPVNFYKQQNALAANNIRIRSRHTFVERQSMSFRTLISCEQQVFYSNYSIGRMKIYPHLQDNQSKRNSLDCFILHAVNSQSILDWRYQFVYYLPNENLCFITLRLCSQKGYYVNYILTKWNCYLFF